MHDFLLKNREDLIARCAAKASLRAGRGATLQQLSDGIPLFLDQLSRTPATERGQANGESVRISGQSGGAFAALPTVETVVASGYSQRPDPLTGHVRDRCAKGRAQRK